MYLIDHTDRYNSTQTISKRGVVVWLLALSPHSNKVLGSIPGQDVSVWSLNVPSVSVWVLFRFSRSSNSPKTCNLVLFAHLRLVETYSPLGQEAHISLFWTHR